MALSGRREFLEEINTTRKTAATSHKYTGEFIKTVEALADDEWWLESKVVNIRQIRRMEDVEYVSELFVGSIAGPQDKKKSLDEYFENFDSEMPEPEP